MKLILICVLLLNIFYVCIKSMDADVYKFITVIPTNSTFEVNEVSGRNRFNANENNLPDLCYS